MLLLFSIMSIANVMTIDVGLASVYNDKIYACPKTSYKHTGLPTAAHRELPCGTVINVKRVDTGKTVKAVVADRGPFGACVPYKGTSRACGNGLRWINGRDFVRKKKPMVTAVWRGILDMSLPLAKLLNVKNRLVMVVIYTDFANNVPSNVWDDDVDDPKLSRKVNEINSLTLLENANKHEVRIATNKSRDR